MQLLGFPSFHVEMIQWQTLFLCYCSYCSLFFCAECEFLAKSTIPFKKADDSLVPIIEVYFQESERKAILNDN